MRNQLLASIRQALSDGLSHLFRCRHKRTSRAWTVKGPSGEKYSYVKCLDCGAEIAGTIFDTP